MYNCACMYGAIAIYIYVVMYNYSYGYIICIMHACMEAFNSVLAIYSYKLFLPVSLAIATYIGLHIRHLPKCGRHTRVLAIIFCTPGKVRIRVYTL